MDQGFIVLATRKPRVSNRTLILRLKRTAARTCSLSLRQEPAADDAIAWIASPQPC